MNERAKNEGDTGGVIGVLFFIILFGFLGYLAFKGLM